MGVIIRQKTKGKGQPWWVFISHNGKRTSRKVGAKDAAKKVASKIEAKLKLGEFGFEQQNSHVPVFKEYSDSWIKTTVPATCKESTLSDYEDILKNHVLPVFKNHEITKITKGQIKDFLLEKLNKGYAVSTVTHIKNVVSGVLNKAVDNEIIAGNPVHSLGKNFLKVKDKREHIDPLTAKELKKLLDTAQAHCPEDYPLFLLLARTGMRIGEPLALQWGDIDFAGRFITVKQALSRGRVETPKSGKIRRVDMSLQLKEALTAYKLKAKKKGFALGLGDAPAYVFTNRLGLFIDVNNWRRRIFNKALEKAGLRKIRIHDLRHTYATLRLAKGDNVGDVANQLGHHSPKLTWDIYYHWMPGKKKAEVDALDDVEYREENQKAENE